MLIGWKKPKVCTSVCEKAKMYVIGLTQRMVSSTIPANGSKILPLQHLKQNLSVSVFGRLNTYNVA